MEEVLEVVVIEVALEVVGAEVALEAEEENQKDLQSMLSVRNELFAFCRRGRGRNNQ